MLSVILSLGNIGLVATGVALTVRERRRADAACVKMQQWLRAALDAEARTTAALATLQQLNGQPRTSPPRPRAAGDEHPGGAG